jgi:hypothetical protein
MGFIIFENILNIFFLKDLFLSFLIPAELLRIRVDIFNFFLFDIFIDIAHPLLCHQRMIHSFQIIDSSLIKFSTIMAYSSRVRAESRVVFQNQGRSGIITLYQILLSSSHTFIQLLLLPHHQ